MWLLSSQFLRLDLFPFSGLQFVRTTSGLVWSPVEVSFVMGSLHKTLRRGTEGLDPCLGSQPDPKTRQLLIGGLTCKKRNIRREPTRYSLIFFWTSTILLSSFFTSSILLKSRFVSKSNNFIIHNRVYVILYKCPSL